MTRRTVIRTENMAGHGNPIPPGVTIGSLILPWRDDRPARRAILAPSMQADLRDAEREQHSQKGGT